MIRYSIHYRNDNSEGIENHIKDYLDHNYLLNIKCLQYNNPKLLIVFSGGNAVGKSSIAHEIEKNMNGLVLENDEIKRSLLKLDPSYDTATLNRLTWQYSMDLYRHLDNVTTNGLVVRDGIIDWYYDRILPIFEKSNYILFIVGFDISIHKAIELIHNRGDTEVLPEEKFYELLDEHRAYLKRFRRAYTPDIILNDSNLFDHELILKRIKVILDRLR